MQQQLNRTLRLGVIAGALALMYGCATVTPEQLSAVESKASSALSEARAAASTANGAMKLASEAAEAAKQAQSAADAAMACCSENKDRIERMFEQTMRK